MKTKADPPPNSGEGHTWSTEFARQANRIRERTRQLARAKRESLRKLEARLGERLQLLGEQLVREQAAGQERSQTQLRRAEALEERAVELDMLKEQLDEQARRLAEQKHELERRETELTAQIAETLSRPPPAPPEDSRLPEVLELRLQCKRLQERLAEAEAFGAKSTATVDEQQHDDLRRRFEMAVQDVRELKEQNTKLVRDLETQRHSESGGGGPAEILGTDWESQKRRLMQQLDGDFDSASPRQAADRLTIEGAIRITDQVVAEKEAQILELRRQLEELRSQSVSTPTEITPDAALAHDELIRQERDNLSHIQDEWRNKLRKAEVDISLERARLARERAELEEKILRLASAASAAANSGGAAGDKAKKPRRWLSLLVKDGDDK